VFLNANYGSTSPTIPVRNHVDKPNYQVIWPDITQYRTP
jgi:hypothetical protein